MKVPIHHIDAFASEVFRGNPAAACPLPARLPDSILQSIAAENNLAETAFLVGGNGDYEIRWFTPITEVDDGTIEVPETFERMRHDNADS